jgi:hypothetical protein
LKGVLSKKKSKLSQYAYKILLGFTSIKTKYFDKDLLNGLRRRSAQMASKNYKTVELVMAQFVFYRLVLLVASMGTVW